MMNKLLSQFASDESGAAAIEYALVILVSIGVVAVVSATLKPAISSLVSTISVKLDRAVNNFS
jgi:Flp pilus assembly pilin Flp